MPHPGRWKFDLLVTVLVVGALSAFAVCSQTPEYDLRAASTPAAGAAVQSPKIEIHDDLAAALAGICGIESATASRASGRAAVATPS